MKVELGLSQYATKDLASLKTKVDSLNVEKLKTVSDDLSKLNNIVFIDVL